MDTFIILTVFLSEHQQDNTPVNTPQNVNDDGEKFKDVLITPDN